MSQPKRAGGRTPHQHISLDAVRVLFGRRVIAFRPEFAALGIGTKYGPLGAKGALFLSQAFYFAENTKDPLGWWTKTQKEIFAVTGLSEDEQLTVRAELRRRGYMLEDQFGIPVTDHLGHTFIGPGRLHYKLGLEAIHEHLEIQVTVYPNWVTTGDTTPEEAAERRKKRNEADRERRKRLKEARDELARLGEQSERVSDETAVRVSEETGYAFRDGANPENDGMRIRQTRIHVDGASGDTQPEQAEGHYIEHPLLEDAARKQQQYGEPDDFTGDENEFVVVVESDLENDEPAAQPQASDPGEQRAERVFKELRAEDLSEEFAKWAVSATIKGRAGLDVCERQLEFWPFYGDKRTPGLLRRAIENDYGPPAAYKQHQAAERAEREAAERAEREAADRARREAEAAANRRAGETEKEAENRRAREIYQHWQDVWAALTEDERDLVVLRGLKLADDDRNSFVRDRYNKTARDNAKSGANGGKGVLPVEWRNKAIEFMLQQGELEEPGQAAPGAAAAAPPAPVAPEQEQATAEDILFEHMPAEDKAIIEAKLKTFKEAPQTPANRAAYLQTRRAHVRAWFNKLETAPGGQLVPDLSTMTNGNPTKRKTA
jgi:hypothetical protein